MKLNHIVSKALLVVALSGIPFQIVFAQSPQGLNYQAIARNSSGIVLPNQNIGLRFTITNGNGGSILYEETQATATNQFGLFTLNVGSGTVVTGTFSNISWSTVTPWLKVDMDATGGTNYVFMGTSQLLSVPYALYAANAPKGGGTLDSAYNFGGAGAGKVITANNGPVTINTSSAGADALLVTTSGNGVAIQASSSLAGSTNPTIQSSTAASSNTVAAVIGDVTKGGIGIAGQVEATGVTGARPVFGNNLRTAGGVGVEGDGFNGIDGEAYNVQGFGVYGNNNTAANGSYSGVLWAPGLNGIGFIGGLGQTQTDSGVGLLGINIGATRDGSTDNGGVEGRGFIGVVGKTNTSGTFGSGGGAGLGSYGDAVVLGNLIVTGAKSFMIDDPLDPANKFLKHFCVESNEVLNIYRGRVQLDANGEAVVELPSYFASINTNFTYQLTSIGQPGSSLYIKSEVRKNSFVIAGNPNQLVCWEVTAERNDLFLQHHPEERINEIAKRGGLIGKYMHPAEYGKPENRSVIPPANTGSLITIPGDKSLSRKNLMDSSAGK